MSDAVIVVDASLAIRAVIALTGPDALDHVVRWRMEDRQLAAPDLWVAETASAVRRLVFDRLLTTEEGLMAIDDLFALGVAIVPTTLALAQAALQWAARLQQSKAYDSLYLAVADHLDAELWTADRRLAERVRQVGSRRVHCVG